MSFAINVASDNWSLFVRAYDRVDPDVCPAILAYYEEVNDDPDCPPYDAPALRCTALDELF